MATISLPGLQSGIDTTALVTGLMNLARKPLTDAQNKKTTIQSKRSAVLELETRLGQLRDLAKTLWDPTANRAVTASSSNNAVATAWTAAGAAEGSHSVEVHQLATAQKRIQMAGFASAGSTVGSSRSSASSTPAVADADAVWFTTGEGGATYTFDFGAETDLTGVVFAANTSYSLNQVRDLINARSQTVAGYDAAGVVESGGLYSLQLTSRDAGPVGAMTQTLTAGTAIDPLNDDADWTKTDGASGAFSYTYKGVTRTLNTSSGSTLTSVRDLINNDGANPGVTASLLYYGSTYHLVLTGSDTGAANTITINDAATTLAGFDSADVVETQAAQDSQFRVDGFPSTDWLTRSSNSVTDVVPGVTLNLQGVGTANVTLTRNTGTLKSNLSNLVEIYNGLVDTIKEDTKYNASQKTGGILQGDALVVGLLTQARSALVGIAQGFDGSSDPYSLPSQLGIEIDKDGKLKLDSTKLDAALSNNYLGVLSLVGALGTGVSSSTYIQMTTAGKATQPGTYEVEADFDASGSVTTGRIRLQGETAWRTLSVNGSSLLGASGKAEEGLLLTAVSDGTAGAHTQTANVRVRQGFAGTIFKSVDQILDPTNGGIAAEKNQFDSQTKLLDARIGILQDRLDKEQKRLQAQFARLEATLANLGSQKSAFDALMTSLNMNSSSSSSSSKS